MLVVEDHTAMRRMLVDQLEEEGIHAAVARSVDEALAVLDREEFSAVLTELDLPGADGLELVRTVSVRFDGPPAILMTPFGSVDTERRARRAGAVACLSKPFGPDELLSVLHRAFEHAS